MLAALLPVVALLLPDGAVVLRGGAPAHQSSPALLALHPANSAGRGGNLALMAVSDAAAADAADERRLQQPRTRRSWRKRAKSASIGLATAAVLAMPRGPARAAELQQRPTPTPVSRDVDRSREPPLAFLGMRQRKVTPPLEHRTLEHDTLDMDKLAGGKKGARKYTDRNYLFSDELTAKTALEEELEELDEVKSERGVAKAVGTAVVYGGALGGVFLTVRGLQNVERWMKEQELRDIEEERELTGQYISVDASDVDTSIDPTTGKNLTIVKKGPQKNATSTAADAPEEEAATSTPWILRVLGLGGSTAADSDDFWEAPAATVRKDGSVDSGSDGGSGDAPDGADPADPSAPTDGGDGGDGEGGEEGEDTTGMDTLDDLLG